MRSNIRVVHSHLTEVLATLDDARAVLRTSTDRIAVNLRSTRPAPERWSAAEVLEHISLAEAGFVNWLAAGIAEARGNGLGAETGERLSLPESVRARLHDRANRRVAPDRVQPKGEMSADAAWSAVVTNEQRLRQILEDADGLALNAVTIEHPVLGPFNVYQWVELMAAHRRRHAEQLDEIAQALTAPAGQV